MNRSTFALAVALLVHLLLVLIFWILGTISPNIEKSKKPQEKKIKISLKEMPKIDKKSGLTKEKIKPSPIAPPMPKGSQLKKIVKQPPVKYEPKKPVKKPTLNKKPTPTKPKPKAKPKVEPLPPTKPYIPLLAKKPDINLTKKPKEKAKPKDDMAWLYEDKSAQEETKEQSKLASGASAGKNIKELYGEEFGKLTPGQQKYIIDNEEIMRRITQQVLNRVARVNLSRDLNVNRTNVIEFKLHPNGDMSDFKFLEKSGYYVLDDTTKETISYAYSRYPRPKEVILIRYNVFYNLARH
ncbi:MAG: energy transducer TonB [Campylobacterota bacterium]